MPQRLLTCREGNEVCKDLLYKKVKVTRAVHRNDPTIKKIFASDDKGLLVKQVSSKGFIMQLYRDVLVKLTIKCPNVTSLQFYQLHITISLTTGCILHDKK